MNETRDTDPVEELEPVSEEELAEAERLARALDQRSVWEVPDDALQAGLLLRTLNDPGLEDARADAILDDVLSRVRPKEPRRRRWAWPFVWATLGSSALVVVAMLEQRPPPSVVDRGLPDPSVELLESQAARLNGEEVGRYRSSLAGYRREVLDSLRPGRPTKP